jgi:GntR family transcriptional regulator
VPGPRPRAGHRSHRKHRCAACARNFGELPETPWSYQCDPRIRVSFTVADVTEVPPWEPVGAEYMYRQIARHLEARIRAGEFAPGQRLPRERDLATEYGAGFHTVRKALEVLREQGIATTLHGKGTYATGQK